MKTFLTMLIVFVVSSAPELPFTHVTPVPAPFLGVLSGVVRDDNNEPIKGALVSAMFVSTGEIRSSLTDKEGRFDIPELQIGEHKVNVAAAGFRTLSYTVNVQGRRNSLDVHFAPTDRVRSAGESNRCRIEGIVKDLKTDKGIAEAKVIVRELDSRGRTKHETKTNEHGKYAIANVSPGRVKLEVSASDYNSPQVRRFTLEARDIEPCDIRMKPKK